MRHRDDIDRLQEFLASAIAQARTPCFTSVLLALVGGIIWRRDVGPIDAWTFGGKMKNVLDVSLGGRRYCFHFDRERDRLEVRKANQLGPLVASFDASSRVEEIHRLFSNL